MLTEIEHFAHELLSNQELKLAEHLSVLLGDDKWNAGPLMTEILPVYNDEVEGRLRNSFPYNIYRPLMYVEDYSSGGDIKNSTRAYLDVISAHIEGCLENLLHLPVEGRAMARAFGPAVVKLKKAGVLPSELDTNLFRFNDAINVPAKHFGSYAPTQWADERTFSVLETTYAIVLMRKLSMQLFELLQVNGILLPHLWPEFKDEWLSSYCEYDPNSG